MVTFSYVKQNFGSNKQNCYARDCKIPASQSIGAPEHSLVTSLPLPSDPSSTQVPQRLHDDSGSDNGFPCSADTRMTITIAIELKEIMLQYLAVTGACIVFGALWWSSWIPL